MLPRQCFLGSGSRCKGTNVGALRIRIGFWGFLTRNYTIVYLQNPILIIKAPILLTCVKWIIWNR